MEIGGGRNRSTLQDRRDPNAPPEPTVGPNFVSGVTAQTRRLADQDDEDVTAIRAIPLCEQPPRRLARGLPDTT